MAVFYGDVLLARIFHEWPAAATDMAVLPCVLGCRTLSILFKYTSGPTPCGCTVARPPRLARMTGRHTHLRGLETPIHEICGLAM